MNYNIPSKAQAPQTRYAFST